MVEQTETIDAPAADEQVDENIEEVQPVKEYYLDPEGGYPDADIGRAAELIAMTKQSPVSVNNLPTKAYLE